MQTIQNKFVTSMCLLFVLILSFSFFVSAVNEDCPISVYTMDNQELCFYNDGNASLFMNDNESDFDFAVLIFEEGVADIKVDEVVINSFSCGGESYGPEGSSSFCVESGQLVEENNVFEIVVGGESYFFAVVLDMVAPITNDNAPITTQTTAFNITLTATDDISGVDYTSYRINNGSWVNGIVVEITSSGDYIIEYYSVDKVGNIESIKSVSVSLAIPVIVTPTTTGGGGGGGYCTTDWTCSAWSECVDGLQTRICSYPAGFCTPISNKPIESLACNSGADDDDIDAEVEAEGEETGFFSVMTGAVIGTATGRWSLAIILFLIILGLAWWIVAKKRKSVKTSKKK